MHTLLVYVVKWVLSIGFEGNFYSCSPFRLLFAYDIAFRPAKVIKRICLYINSKPLIQTHPLNSLSAEASRYPAAGGNVDPHGSCQIAMQACALGLFLMGIAAMASLLYSVSSSVPAPSSASSSSSSSVSAKSSSSSNSISSSISSASSASSWPAVLSFSS